MNQTNILELEKEFKLGDFTNDFKQLNSLTVGIYALIFPNRKIYVGRSTDVELALCNRPYAVNKKIKQDYENVSREFIGKFCSVIVYPCEIADLFKKRKEIINLHNSIENGYNPEEDGISSPFTSEVYTEEELNEIKVKNENTLSKRIYYYNLRKIREKAPTISARRLLDMSYEELFEIYLDTGGDLRVAAENIYVFKMLRERRINCIYLLTFPDGQKYVGRTSDFHSRIYIHRFKPGKHGKLKDHITKFRFLVCIKAEILEEVKIPYPELPLDSVENSAYLDSLENKWIQELDTINNGLNCIAGTGFSNYSEFKHPYYFENNNYYKIDESYTFFEDRALERKQKRLEKLQSIINKNN